MEPKDALWRLLDCIDQCIHTLDETHGQLDPKTHGDILRAVEECERLANTQRNILNRLRRRYS